MNRPPVPLGDGPEDFDRQVREVYLAHASAVLRSSARAAMGDYGAAEDATQQAFIEATGIWAKFRQWPPGKQRAWLRTSARYRLIDSWRASREEVLTDMPPDENVTWSTEDTALSDLALDRFWKLVTSMPQRQARAAYLKWHERWTMTEIAKHLGINRATVHRDLDDVIDVALKQLGDEIGFSGHDGSKEA